MLPIAISIRSKTFRSLSVLEALALNRIINEAISSGMVKASLERAKLAGVGVAPLGKATR